MTRRYLLLQHPPFTVTFPKSRHEFSVEPLSGGATMLGEAVWVLTIHNSTPGKRGSSSWLPAEATSKEKLEAKIYKDGFDLPWPSGQATILERAVKDGLAKRV